MFILRKNSVILKLIYVARNCETIWQTLEFLTGGYFNEKRGQRQMKKIFTKQLLMYMAIALVTTIVVVFALQTFTNRYSNVASSKSKLEDVREKLVNNEESIAQLTETLGQNNLAKARAVANMIAEAPAIANDAAKLSELKDRLMVNEIHIIDEDGIITCSTVDAYFGFDMKSGEQSNAFMVIVDDPSIEIVQEPQRNVADGIVMQYIGVARLDDKGLLQVGVRPEVLEEVLAGTDLSVVLGEMEFGDNGYIYAMDKASGTLLAHPNRALIGTSAVEAGFPESFVGSGKAKVDGQTGYFYAEEEGDMVIGTFLSSSEYYATRRSQTLLVSLSVFLIFGVLLFMINRMVDSKIVQGMNNITSSTKKIADGDFDISINEKGNPEFEQLSDSINWMVESICQSMQKNENLIRQQETDVENNRMLIENVKNACKELGHVAGQTLENADNIYDGTGKQEKSVSDLKQIMEQLAQELNRSAESSADIFAVTEMTTDKIKKTQAQMALLQESMQKISDMSMKIEQIIDEINSIAQQTNMLSLNASIEAARAGDTGKGFAVVATQVGELAARSSKAAKDTYDLISNSLQAVEEGQSITKQTVDVFADVAENIAKSMENVSEISNMVQQNADIVKLAVNQLGQISDVVEENVQISYNTKEVSTNMADITGNLLALMDN